MMRLCHLKQKKEFSHSYESEKSRKLGIYDLKGAFLILLICHTLAFTVFLIEITFKNFITQYCYTLFFLILCVHFLHQENFAA